MEKPYEHLPKAKDDPVEQLTKRATCKILFDERRWGVVYAKCVICFRVQRK